MKIRKKVKIIGICFLMLTLIMANTGCSLVKKVKEGASKKTNVSKEDSKYIEAVDSFLDAVNSNELEAVRNLFSVNVQNEKADMDKQITKLFKLGLSSKYYWNKEDINLQGDYKNEYGDKRCVVTSTFPILFSDEKYYWCSLKLTYRDDFDKDEIGITSVCLYSKEYMCALWYGEKGAIWSNDPGIHLKTNYHIDDEIRVVSANPYKFIPSNPLKEDKVKAFLKKNNSYDDFVKEFGEPNALNIFSIYELPEEDGNPRYLILTADEKKDGLIYSASVADDFKWLYNVWDDNE